MDLLGFVPIYQDRVWGGNNLRHVLGRELPHDGPIGEAWEIVDRPEAESIHTASNQTLAQLLKQHPEKIMGPEWMRAHAANETRRFPILVKWLDCQDRLSLQVHPPAHVASDLGGEPKTECWYIASATPEAALYVGLKQSTKRKDFESVLTESGGAGLAPLVHRIPVQSGESILLESGRIHAIDAGNLILEIQQNSDTTYRVYDWDRVGLDGVPRDLHIEESLASIDFDDFEPATVPASEEPGERILAECDSFRIRHIILPKGESIEIEAQRAPSIISVVDGALQTTQTESKNKQHLNRADNVICPYVWGGVIEALEDSVVLITDGFV
ncbi:MAG TPA: type I phosphomannose isomerase catalytic subunit [Wenzhouxiangella sp.]